MNDDEKRAYNKILDWIDEAEHHKYIKAMKPLYDIPEYVIKMGAALNELLKQIRHENKNTIK